MPADRARYADQQAALLRALQTGQTPPPGFADDDLTAASSALLDKRMRAVAQRWPGLGHALGTDFPVLFERYAHDVPPPVAGAGLADGYAFATSLDPTRLTDDARTELLLARALLKLHGARVVPRRGIFLATKVLAGPRRSLIVIHLPLLGRRQVALWLPSGRGA